MRCLLDLQPSLSLVLTETQGASVTRYVHAPRGIHAQKDSGGNWEWMVNDGLGSVREVVDNNLNVLWSNNFDPFGTGFGSVGTGQTAFGYTGEQTEGTGQVYLRARYYDPSIGVFPNLDPFEGKPCEPMSLNRYGYVAGNPVNMIDPSGKAYELPSMYAGCISFSLSAMNIPFCSRGISRGFSSRFDARMGFIQVPPTPNSLRACDVLPTSCERCQCSYNLFVQIVQEQNPSGFRLPTLEEYCKGCENDPLMAAISTSVNDVAYVIACEAGYFINPNSTFAYQQAVDIANSIRARMTSGIWPNDALGVVSQGSGSQYNCYKDIVADNRNSNINVQGALGLATALVSNSPLPDPTDSRMKNAPYFFAPGSYGAAMIDRPADTLGQATVIANLYAADPNVLYCNKSQDQLNNTYAGHSPWNSLAKTTIFFTEFPECYCPGCGVQ